MKNSEIKVIGVTNVVMKGTVTTLAVVILGFSTLTGTNSQIFYILKGNDEYPSSL